MVARTKHQQRGFTLIEMLITTVIAGVAIAGAFTFASFQVKSYADQQDVAQMHTSARFVFEALVEDLRNAGFGTSYWAGLDEVAAFGGNAVVLDGAAQPLGVPALRVADALTGPTTGAPDGLGVMINTDAISLLRVVGPSTNLPASGPNQLGIPSSGGGATYTVEAIERLFPCGQLPVADPTASHLVLVSDLVRQGEPSSMLLEIANFPAVLPPPGQGTFSLVVGAYGIDFGSLSGPGVAPTGVGPGSIVTCVQLVTYWVDNLNRLRMWRSTPADPSGSAAIAGSGALAGPLPINPAQDAVLAEGVADLQVALFMSGMAGIGAGGTAVANAWNYANAAEFSTEQELVETRAVRISVLLASPRRGEQRAVNAPPQLENHVTGAGFYDPAYHYRAVQYQAELRNMRLFDLQSSNLRSWDSVRSYP